MRITLFVIALVLLVVFSQVAGQENSRPELNPAESSDPEDFNFWMNVKLLEAQKLLEALAKSDFDRLTKSAQTLETLSAVEGFVRRRIPGYAAQLRSFEYSVNEIKKQAMRENIEGVTLGFQQLTLSCVNCHKQVRLPTVSAPEKSVD